MTMNRVLVTGGSGFIGTNLIQSFAADRIEVINYDRKPPANSLHDGFYVCGDILDRARLLATVKDFRPDSLVHLAARCDLAGKTLGDYAANIDGVRNIISEVKGSGSIRRAIFASSRYVHCNEKQPESDDEYSPFTMYGASKVEGERIVRNSRLEVPWLIIRPTSIWGPWFDIPYKGFFQAIRRGLYVHPSGEKIYKSYGYVGNVVHQIRQFLAAEKEAVHGRTFYTADYEPIEIRSLAEKIRREFGAPAVREAPLWTMKPFAFAGDVLKKLGWYNPPLTSFRLTNLRCQMIYDVSKTAQVVGESPYSVDEGVAHTVEWMKEHDRN